MDNLITLPRWERYCKDLCKSDDDYVIFDILPGGVVTVAMIKDPFAFSFGPWKQAMVYNFNFASDQNLMTDFSRDLFR